MYGSAIRIVLVCFGGFEVGVYWLDPSLGPIISQVQAAHFKSYGEDGMEGPERQRVEEDVCFQQVSWRPSLDCLGAVTVYYTVTAPKHTTFHHFSPLPMCQPIYLHVHLQFHACHWPLELRLLSREPQPRNNP